MQLFYVINIKGGWTKLKRVVVVAQLNESVSQHPLPVSEGTQVEHLNAALKTLYTGVKWMFSFR